MKPHYKVAVVGGGLGGLVCSLLLARKGIETCLFERKSYPFHRVCGEYISNEVTPFLESLDIYPSGFNPAQINRFNLTSVNGKVATSDLALGGFGISRFSFDNFLAEKCRSANVDLFSGMIVDDISFGKDGFLLQLNNKEKVTAEIVVGAFGKRSGLDKKLSRKFLQHTSPYIGVKYHIQYDIPENEISLHNFKGGYCGVSRVEGGASNLCYLSERNNLKKYGSVSEMEANVICQNPFLEKIWTDAKFLFESPLVINEINFESKDPVENHLLMIGDAAGMITPLCGNGMAIAIHSAKIASEEIQGYFDNRLSRESMENQYRMRWKNQFATRLSIGRSLQKLFGSVVLSNLSVALLKNVQPVGRYLISKTHGSPISASV